MEPQPDRKTSADLQQRIDAMKLKYEMVIKPFYTEERIPLMIEYYETHTLEETIAEFTTEKNYLKRHLK